MAVEAKNICFENMGFGAYTISGAQDCFMGSSSGLQDAFLGQEQPNLYQQDSQDRNVAGSSSASFCGGLPLDALQSLSTELQRQRAETDWFLEMENRRLRSFIQLETSRQRALIIQTYESRFKSLMLQMDEQIAISRNRTAELQSSLQIAEHESQSWQKKAAENAATASSLRERLDSAAQELETVSSCGSSSTNATSENETGDHIKQMYCKLCQTRSSCSVFLPCRHLSSCKACEPLLGHCPVCGTVKEASLDVLLG